MRIWFWKRSPAKSDTKEGALRRAPSFDVTRESVLSDTDAATPSPVEIEQPAEHVSEVLDGQALSSSARRAAAEGDWHTALRLWQKFTQVAEENIEGYLGQAEAYRSMGQPVEADTILHMSLGAESPEWAVSYALNAVAAEDWEEALDRWHSARMSYPDLAIAWAGEASLLQVLRRVPEAGALTRQAIAEFPDSIDIHAQHCSVAAAQGNWLELKRRWSELERRFPGSSYVAQKRPEILQMVRAGTEEASTQALVGLVSQLEAESAWADAATVWREIHAREPRLAASVIGLGRALRENHRFTDADRVLEGGIVMFPQDLEMRAHHAQVAAVREDWPEAAARWEKTLSEFPDRPVVWGLASTVFRQAGLVREAESLLESGLRIEPERLDFLVGYALAAESRGAWRVAVERWNIIVQLKPGDASFRALRDHAAAQDAQARISGSTA